MNIKKYIIASAAAFMPFAAFAQEDAVRIDFEDASQYKNISIYDSWEESPFRNDPSLGNFKVVENIYNQQDTITLDTPNPSEHVLGVERSIIGSNLFGVRVDLNQPYHISDNTTRYVHVKMRRPEDIDGRVMIIGLGKHSSDTPDYEQTWASQPDSIEQFTVLGNQKPAPGYWSDVVFPIKCAGKVDIYSLVVVVDCEAPHTRENDFIVYIDDILINNSARPNVKPHGYYAVCFEEGEQATNNNRQINYVTVETNEGSFVKKANGKAGLTEVFDNFVPVKRGTEVRVTTNYTGNSMNSYVYFDANNDGRFDEADNNEYVGKEKAFGATHSFTVPSSLETGVYRLRTKIDYQNSDPAGNSDQNQYILSNGGGMIDVLLWVHDGSEKVIVNNYQRNGHITLVDSTHIDNLEHARNTELKVKAVPSDDFECAAFTIKVGKYFTEEDSLFHGNPQYLTIKTVRYRQFDDENCWTIPASYFYADMKIEGYMVEELPVPSFLPVSKDPIDGKFRASSRPLTLKVKNGYVTLNCTDNDGALKLTDATEPTNSRGYWVVCGNDEEGYQFYNVAKGANYVLGCKNRNENARFKLYPIDNIPADVTTLFDYQKSTYQTNPYKDVPVVGADGTALPVSPDNATFRLHGTTQNCWNDRGSYLALWDAQQAFGNDGSRIEVHDVNYDCVNRPDVVEVNYTIKIDDVEISTVTELGILGEPFPATDSPVPFYTVEVPKDTLTTGGNVEAKLVWNGPFKLSPAPVGSSFADGAQWYYMKNGNNAGNGFVVYENNESGKSGFNTAIDSTKLDCYKWCFVRKTGSTDFYIYNKQAGGVALHEQLSSSGSWASSHNQGYCVAKESVSGATINELLLALVQNGVGYSMKLQGVNGTCILGKHTSDGKFSIWGNNANTNDNGSRFIFQFAEEQLPDGVERVNLTYQFMFEETKVATQTTVVLIGDDYPTFSANLPFGLKLPEQLTGKVQSADTIHVALEWNLPFKHEKSIETATGWYVLRANTPDTKRMLYYVSGQTPNVKSNKVTTATDAYLWTIVGDPITGFTVFNRLAGKEVALNNQNKCNIDAAGLQVKFRLEPGNGNRPGEIAFVDPALTSNPYLNDGGAGGLGRWRKDDGSSFAVERILPVFGDVDGDEDIDMDDVDALVKHLSSSERAEWPDVDDSKKVSIKDLTELIKLLLQTR
ncbi:MAG: hypothetical protein KBT12_03345 [Bacteroidales bacterium]|nr:hypothetical protein [Candidatus Physcousia equi]